jgi:uncharacterized membrane protein YbhN (UPF0104 family)
MSDDRQEGLPQVSLDSLEHGKGQSRNFQVLLVTIKGLAGIALLILALHGINYENLVSGIRSADLTWLFLAILSILFGLGLKLFRWGMLLKKYRLSVSLSRLFSAYFVGQATNILLPFRGGELARLGYFAEQKNLLPQAASTIVVEKYLDLLALTGLGIMVSYKISIDNVLDLRAFLLPMTILASLLLLAAILYGPTAWLKIREKRIFPKRLTPWIDRWVQASLWLRDPRQTFPLAILTIIIWGVMWLTNLLLFNSLGLPLGGTAGGLVLVLVYIGLLPALMPGNVGPFYFFAGLALLPFGILLERAVVFAMLLHAIVTLPPLLCGALSLFIRSPRPASA